MAGGGGGQAAITVETGDNQPKQNSQRYIVVFDYICTMQSINPPKKVNRSINANIFVKNAVSRSLIYRSPFSIDHELKADGLWTQTDISEHSDHNYFIFESHQKITVEL